MSIRINQSACIGCGKCTRVCPGNLIKKDVSDKATIKHIEDCWGCTSCLKECSVGAIDFFLGADISGRGTTMHTEIAGDICSWVIKDPDGTLQRVEINKKDANQY